MLGLEKHEGSAGGARVGGGAVVRIVVVDDVGHRVHHHLTHARGAGGESGQHGGRRGGGRHVRQCPVRGAEAADAADNVEAAANRWIRQSAGRNGSGRERGRTCP